jgi:hypothetical protein
MKHIKIAGQNAAAIVAALAVVNKNSVAHTYTTAQQIFDLAAAAEKRLSDLHINKSDRPGAAYASTSGGAVPNAYKYSRIGTSVLLERRASGWWLNYRQNRSAHFRCC